MSSEELKKLSLKLIEGAWPAYLTTVDRYGFPQTRAMFNLRNPDRFPKLVPFFEEYKDDFIIIFSTNTSSTKIEDIKKNPKVSVYYCIPEEWQGAMFGGEIEIVDDAKVKKALWHEGWERYYPGGYDDPDHTVLKLHPNMVRGWNQSQTFRLSIGEGQWE
ncbi:MAG: pyridoxamine 5'-phosphate oxidase family protein [Candidatus Hodarchaeota archaeon]